MAPKLGYLLPTRERIMQGAPETEPMLALAARAEASSRPNALLMEVGTNGGRSNRPEIA